MFYAHSPDALRRTLASARALCTGRLWVVVGAGGQRDVGKRSAMGRAAGSRTRSSSQRTTHAARIPPRSLATSPRVCPLGGTAESSSRELARSRSRRPRRTIWSRRGARARGRRGCGRSPRRCLGRRPHADHAPRAADRGGRDSPCRVAVVRRAGTRETHRGRRALVRPQARPSRVCLQPTLAFVIAHPRPLSLMRPDGSSILPLGR
ncbi:MAG: hypothetical protein IPQ09_02565 [Myxococcales bacterium]|nr:hypothetical protein [Myxococcales bacterium]